MKTKSAEHTRDRVKGLLLSRGEMAIQTLYNHLERDGRGAHGSLKRIQDIVYELADMGELERVGVKSQRRYKLAPAVAARELGRPLDDGEAKPSDESRVKRDASGAIVELYCNGCKVMHPVAEFSRDSAQRFGYKSRCTQWTTPSKRRALEQSRAVTLEIDTAPSDDTAPSVPEGVAVQVPEIVEPEDLQQLLASQGFAHLLEQLESHDDDRDHVASDAGAPAVVEQPATIVIGPLAQQIARAVAMTAEHYLQTQSREFERTLQRNAELARGLKRKDEQIAALQLQLEQRPYTTAELEQLRCEILEKNTQIAELERRCAQLQSDVDTALATAQEAEQKINALRDIFK